MTRIKHFIFCLFVVLLLANLHLSAEMNDKLKAIGQEHLLKHWDSLSAQEREQLSAQINQIDPKSFQEQKKLALQQEQPPSPSSITPFLDFVKSGSAEDSKAGLELISNGKVGCLIVAGGQGTRLRCDGPKGAFPITAVKQKSLFQIFAERVVAASKQAKRPLLLAIMTSPANHKETVALFEQNQFFGLSPKQVSFFSQEELPLLDAKGNLFLETPGRIAAGPDGNAASLKHFVKKGIWSAWLQQGVRYLNYVHIDNPLADPFDAQLVGFHSRQNADLIIKCISRDDPQEKLGVILNKNGRVDVIEYSEISSDQRDARNSDGTLKHQCGNVSMFSFTMDFVKDVAEKHYDKMPYHRAWKAVKHLTPEGKVLIAEKPMAWKYEKFIFDVLPHTHSVKALLYPREECFAPLKNANGSDSLADVQAALQRYDRKAFAAISGKAPEVSKVFELHPQFYYPTPELLAKWKGRSIPEGISYIEP